MEITIVGLGYIGLPTALMLSEHHKIVGVDKNKDLLEQLRSNLFSFKEDELNRLLVKNGKKIEYFDHINKSEMYIVAVPTPFVEETKKIDSSILENVCIEISKVCDVGSIIIIESTISPGTIDRIVAPIFKKAGFEIGKDIYLAHAPERIIPGNTVHELIHNSRTIGCDDIQVANKIKKVYESFCMGEIVLTNTKTAEMSKVVENTFRDINIAFANELALICNEENINVYEVINIVNKHPRVKVLQPGPGVGGHCIAVDPWFLVGDHPNLAKLIRSARETNDDMPRYVLSKLRKIMSEHSIASFKEVGLYGLTYKENVDDTRESPTLQLLAHLSPDEYKEIQVFDPLATKDLHPNTTKSFDDFLNKSKIVVVMVGHNHIRENLIMLNDKIVFDTRNITNNESVYKL